MANTQDPAAEKYRENLTYQRATGRGIILVILAFTVLNMLLLLFKTGKYFVFSAAIPYYLTKLGMSVDNNSVGGYTIVMLVVSLLFMAAYFLCWRSAKDNIGALKVAAILFVVDMVSLAVIGICMHIFWSMVLDLVIHGYLLWEMFQALRADKKLRAIQPQQEK